MRVLLYGILASAIAIPVCAEVYEVEAEFDEDATFVDFAGDFGTDFNAEFYLGNIHVGMHKEARVLFVTPEHYATDSVDFDVTTIEGDSKGSLTCDNNLVGMFQFIDIFPADDCEVKVNFELSTNVQDRLSHGLIKAKDFIPVAIGVKEGGSIITTKHTSGAPGDIAYFDQTDIGWKLDYDESTKTVTVTGMADVAYMGIEDGNFDIGVVIWK
ncbi:MAG: hypothetical protein GY771_06625 [bacterium]|nr:hypothetical protein [bacterium]